MGIGMAYVEYLSERGHFSAPGCRVLDIGSQNLLSASAGSMRQFVARHRPGQLSPDDIKEIDRLAHFSIPRPGERTTYLSELTDLTPAISYTSYDVCPALKTEIFDLNHEQVPSNYRGAFDVILNFGTTEHVAHQLNSFEVMHDAMKVGGISFHQLPSIGFQDHGYFAYHGTFFDDLIKANGYQQVDRWYTLAGHSNLDPAVADIRDPLKPMQAKSGVYEGLPTMTPWYVINVILRKMKDAPFAVGLELATSHSGVAGQVAKNYGAEAGPSILQRVQRKIWR